MAPGTAKGKSRGAAGVTLRPRRPPPVPQPTNWRRPLTWIYNQNYSYSSLYYEPTLDYAEKRKMGKVDSTVPVPKLLTIEEKAMRDLNARFGRPRNKSEERPADQDSPRLSYLKREHERLEKRDENRLRRVKSFNALSSASASQIESDLRWEAAATSHESAVANHKRSQIVQKLEYDHDVHVKHLEDRRAELHAKAKDLEDKLITAGLRLNTTSTVNAIIDDVTSPVVSARLGRSRSAERVLQSSRIETESTSRNLHSEIENLTSRVLEAESRLKSDVNRVKQRYEVELADAELSLNTASKTNAQLQESVQKLAKQVSTLGKQYEEQQRQLETTGEQYAIAQRRAQALHKELEEARNALELNNRSKRQLELQCEEMALKLNEATSSNLNLTSARAKLEAELGALSTSYQETQRELRSVEERYNRVGQELNQTIEVLKEEQQKSRKIESIARSYEADVKNLTVKLATFDDPSAGGKRVASRLEAKILDIESSLEEEKRRHQETIKVLRRKERMLKEAQQVNEDDRKNAILLAEQVEVLTERNKTLKRQIYELDSQSSRMVQVNGVLSDESLAKNYNLSKAKSFVTSKVTTTTTTTSRKVKA